MAIATEKALPVEDGDREGGGGQAHGAAASDGELVANEARAGDDGASGSDRDRDGRPGCVDHPRNVCTAPGRDGDRRAGVMAVLENADPLPGPTGHRRQVHHGAALDLDQANYCWVGDGPAQLTV